MSIGSSWAQQWALFTRIPYQFTLCSSLFIAFQCQPILNPIIFYNRADTNLIIPKGEGPQRRKHSENSSSSLVEMCVIQKPRALALQSAAHLQQRGFLKHAFLSCFFSPAPCTVLRDILRVVYYSFRFSSAAVQ